MIAILTDMYAGGTFLNWSLHYLAGHNQYWNCKQSKMIDLPVDPVGNQSNAHGFQTNQPLSLEAFQSITKSIQSTQHDQFTTLYLHEFSNRDETQQAINIIEDLADKLIFLTHSDHSSLFLCQYKQRDQIPWLSKQGYTTNSDEAYEDYVDHFFADDKAKWQELGLVDIWDKREFIALNFDRSITTSIKSLLNQSKTHYSIDIMDHWNTLNVSIVEMFDYLDIAIDQYRFDSWLAVYRNWQKVHYQQLRFIWYFEKIINYVINGHSMNLERFNLDIMQEAAIQRELMYKHNLNFKTWQLEKFQSTQQLHSLLETNIHPVN
jgi:hypothetical protein|tara:strand:+ start:136 stop:1095 length:960 start_codon:yes stop_codon:yes gene_type:complete